MATTGRDDDYIVRLDADMVMQLRLAAEGVGESLSEFIARSASLRIMRLLSDAGRLGMSEAEQIAFLDRRSSLAEPGQLAAILAKAGTTTDVLPGDELPEGWLESVKAEVRERAKERPKPTDYP